MEYWTLEELRRFDGEQEPRVLVALLGEVYDVSADIRFGPGGEYHLLAGKEATRALARNLAFTNHDLEQLDLSDLTKAEHQVLEEWIVQFRREQHYPVVGRVLIHAHLTTQQLQQYDGIQDPWHRVYVALNGTIYDVTLKGANLYGPAGKYPFCAGKDLSRALATMQFDPDTVEKSDLSDLSDELRLCLADWGLQFNVKYPTVGRLRTELEP